MKEHTLYKIRDLRYRRICILEYVESDDSSEEGDKSGFHSKKRNYDLDDMMDDDESSSDDDDETMDHLNKRSKRRKKVF